MKKKIATVIGWIIYALGDLIAIPMDRFKMSFLWKPYTHVMRTSYKIQIWGGAEEPWKKV